jgi:folate-binding protein YgfZ
MSQTLDHDYRALTDEAGVVDFSHRTRIEVLGEDRASFLHNLSTNDVKKLQPGRGCEAFFLDARGHIRAYGVLICRPTSIVVETVGGQNGPLIQHLDRYLIREKVELVDRTDAWGELFLGGAKCHDLLGQLAPATVLEEAPASVELELAGHAVTLASVQMTAASGYLLFCARPAQPAVAQALIAKGAIWCEPASFEAARIEAGVPLYGVDMTDQNLPQEVARDELAISFKKGCYLGQETVARIDALGHVNKKLVRLRFAGAEVPPPGAELRVDDKVVGQVTSAAFVPRIGASLALGYLRRGYDTPGTKLTSDWGQAVVAGS